MTHKREVVRDYLVTLLGGSATAGSNVFAGRTNALQDSEVPAILVDVTATDLAEELRGATTLRKFEMGILITAIGSYDDEADDISEEIETLMDANPTMGGAVDDSRPGETVTMVGGEGNHDRASNQMEYTADFYS